MAEQQIKSTFFLLFREKGTQLLSCETPVPKRSQELDYSHDEESMMSNWMREPLAFLMSSLRGLFEASMELLTLLTTTLPNMTVSRSHHLAGMKSDY